MKMLIRNLKLVLFLFFGISAVLLAGLVVQQHRSRTELAVAAGENKAALKERYATAGRILAADGTVLAKSANGKRTYAKDTTTAKALLHVVGDYTHRIGNTAEALYQGPLLGSERSFLHQMLLDFTGKGLVGDDLTLTVDAALSKQAYSLLKGRKGAVVLLDWSTGAVRVSVSSPSTSPASVIEWTDIPDTALYDRALLGAYAPGSTFKLVTAAAWLSAPGYDPAFTLDCKGKAISVPNGADETTKGHGEVGLEEAFAESCNVWFGETGMKLGRKRLLDMTGNFGIGKPVTADRMKVRTGVMETEDDPATLSWLAIGQPNEYSRLSLSPLQMAMIAGGIANGGVIRTPHLTDHLTDPLGNDYQKLSVDTWQRILPESTARELQTLMVKTTETGTGSAAAVKGLTVAGKTGTVQVEGQKNNALYVGFLADPQTPYAIAVIVEEGGSGGKTAAPIAASLFRAAAVTKKPGNP